VFRPRFEPGTAEKKPEIILLGSIYVVRLLGKLRDLLYGVRRKGTWKVLVHNRKSSVEDALDDKCDRQRCETVRAGVPEGDSSGTSCSSAHVSSVSVNFK
jgi:hypothetical protein